MENILQWHVPAPKKLNCIFRSADEMIDVWKQHGGDGSKIPDIDFNKYMVVAMFLDAGNYKRAPGIRRIIKEGDVIEIEYAYQGRPWEMINPCCVIQAPRSDVMYVFKEIK